MSPAEALQGCLLCAPAISNPQKKTLFARRKGPAPNLLEKLSRIAAQPGPHIVPEQDFSGEPANLQYFTYLMCCQKCF